MSKLFRLKPWLSLSDAAKRLSLSLGEEVSEVDILQFALQGEFQLSVYFHESITAERCDPIDPAQAEFFDTISLDGQPLSIPKHPYYDSGRGYWLKPNGQHVSLFGLLDIPPSYGARCNLESEFWRLQGHYVEDSENIDGTIVFAGLIENDCFRLVDELPRKTPKEEVKHYPLGRLPKDSILVVRPDSIIQFEQRFAEDTQEPKPQAATLSQKERNGLLNVIGGMLELVLTPRPGRQTQAAVITELVENWGDKPGISKSNLEAKFAEAKRSMLS